MADIKPDPYGERALEKLKADLQEIEEKYPPTEEERRLAAKRRKRERYKMALFLVICVVVSLGGISPSEWRADDSAPYGYPFGAPLSFWAALVGGLVVAWLYLYYTRPEEIVAQQAAVIALWWKTHRTETLVISFVVLTAIQYIRFGLHATVVFAGCLGALFVLFWIDRHFLR